MSSLITAKLMDICHMEQLFDASKSSLDFIEDPILQAHDVQLFIKRDDLIDQNVSGNKWRKLKYNILQCRQYKNVGILTFGGAFSNHLVATAAACKRAGLTSTGVVRGDELNERSNASLKQCSDLGMHLHFISREEYNLRNERYYHEELLKEFPNLYVVPEGGANYWGMIGCQELIKELTIDFNRVVVAQGTTTTSCGIMLGLKVGQHCSLVPVLRGFDSEKEMRMLYGTSGIDSETIDSLIVKSDILDSYHFGGYAKYSEELLQFIKAFYDSFKIKLDPIYTGKAMFALFEEIKAGNYDGEKIVFIHTGGLQGIAGIESKLGRRIFSA